MVALPLRTSVPWLWLVLLSSCASASNSSWLREPEEGLAVGERTFELERNAGSEPAFSRPSAQEFVIANEPSQARTRLRHTVTLGETIAPAPEPSAAAPAANSAPVNVTVNNYVIAPAPVYGRWVEPLPGRAGRSYGSTPRGVSPPSTRGGASAPVSWPSPPSYGPSFPFKTAPASPWR